MERDYRTRQRLKAIRLGMLGEMTMAEVAEKVEVSRTTIGTWSKAFREGQAWLEREHGIKMGIKGVYYWLGKVGGVLKVPRKTHSHVCSLIGNGWLLAQAKITSNRNRLVLN